MSALACAKSAFARANPEANCHFEDANYYAARGGLGEGGGRRRRERVGP